MNKGLTFLLLLLICSACEMVSEIDYNIIEGNDWIVMYGYISKENGVNVLVKKTIPVNDHDADDVVENPIVWLYENDIPLKQLVKTSLYNYCLLADSVLLNEDASYTIKVEADGFATAISKPQQLVAKVIVDTIYFDADSSFLYYEFNDDLVVDNYYSCTVDIYSEGEELDHHDNGQIVPLYVDSDEGYDGRVVKYYELGYMFTREVFDSIQVGIYTYTKDYYDFFSSYLDYEISYGDFDYETVYPVETQIENGFGFFISYEFSKCVLKNSKNN